MRSSGESACQEQMHFAPDGVWGNAPTGKQSDFPDEGK
jgi:hypothetical protein